MTKSCNQLLEDITVLQLHEKTKYSDSVAAIEAQYFDYISNLLQRKKLIKWKLRIRYEENMAYLALRELQIKNKVSMLSSNHTILKREKSSTPDSADTDSSTSRPSPDRIEPPQAQFAHVRNISPRRSSGAGAGAAATDVGATRSAGKRANSQLLALQCDACGQLLESVKAAEQHLCPSVQQVVSPPTRSTTFKNSHGPDSLLRMKSNPRYSTCTPNTKLYHSRQQNQLNQMKHMNQMKQLKQLKLNQLKQLKHLNQLKQMRQLKQLNQLKHTQQAQQAQQAQLPGIVSDLPVLGSSRSPSNAGSTTPTKMECDSLNPTQITQVPQQVSQLSQKSEKSPLAPVKEVVSQVNEMKEMKEMKEVNEVNEVNEMSEIKKVTQKPSEKKKKMFACTRCEKKYSSKDSLACHMNMHLERFKCDECSKCLLSLSALVTHKRSHTGEKPYHCTICDFKCSVKCSLESHIKTHTDNKPFVCKICDHRCRTKGNLDLHMASHSNATPFECEECHKKFKLKSYLKKHMRVHSNEKPFQCDECMQRFTSWHGWKYHCKNVCKIGKEGKANKK